MNLSHRPPVKSHISSWALTAAITSLVITAAVLYVVAWQHDDSWYWAPAITLAYLVPVALASFYSGRSRGLIVALGGALTLVPLVWTGWQLDRPLASLIGMSVVGLALPIWAHVLGTLADSQRHLNDLMLVNRVGQAVTSGLDSQSFLKGIVAASVQLLECEYSVLFFWDDQSEQFVPQAAHGCRLEETGQFGDRSLNHLAGLVREELPVLIADIDTDSRFVDLFAERLRVKSMLAVPLAGGPVSGALVAGATRAGSFDREGQFLLTTLTNEAAATLQNIRLYESTALQVRQLATLNDIGRTVIPSLDTDTTLSLLMGKIQEAFNVESGWLSLVEQDRLKVRAAFGPAGGETRSVALEAGQGIAAWVALTGESALVPDAQADDRCGAASDRVTPDGTRAALCVPLKEPEAHVIGILQLINPREGSEFTRHDLELLESIATFAVIAIQNAQLYQQAEHHVVDLHSLYEVGKEITATLDIEDTLQMVADEVIRLTGAARSQIVLVDESTARVTYLVQRGYGDAPRPCTYDQVCRGLSGWVLGEKTPTLSIDIHQDERMRDVDITQTAGPDAQSMIVAPLLIKDVPVGILSAVSLRDADPFSERELGLLNMLAGQASIAVENAHFFEERKRQIITLSILSQTGQALSSTLDLYDLVELVYHQVARVMDAQSFFVALYDAESDTVSFPIAYTDGVQQAGRGPEPTSEEWLPRQGGHGLPEYVIRTQKALWLPNRVAERLAELGIELSGAPALSWLGVPILSDEQVLGVIAVQSNERNDVYDQEHLELLMTIASQASVAMRNIQLFAQVNQMTENLEALVEERTEALAQANKELTTERDRLNALYHIMRELSGSVELERVLGRTLVLVNDVLPAEQGYILIRDHASSILIYVAVAGKTLPSAEGVAFPSPRLGDKIYLQGNQGPAGQLMSHRELVRIDDLAAAPRWHLLENQDQWHRSALAAPLVTGDEARGAILLFHSAPKHFTTDHQRMLEAIASQIAIAISSVEMFDLLSEAADRLGNMLRAQRQEAVRSHAILEGVADGVMVTDAGGEITLLNAAAERILQTPRADVIGRTERELPGLFGLAGTSWAELTERWSSRKTSPDEEALYEERLEVGDRVISMRVAPVMREGVFEGTVSVFRDITKDVEVDRIKTEFVSMVSHELRTPMTSIKGYVDLLYNGMAGPITDAQGRFLGVIKGNADRLTLLVNDLLDISAVDSGKLKINLETIDPLAVAGDVIAAKISEATEREQTLELLSQGPLPSVRADRARMTQILTSLVDNAIYYTPIGGRIAMSAEVADEFLRFHVSDNGVGISEADQEKLFGRFFRSSDPQVQAHSGTGLALCIAKSIVELHGGEMWFRSKPGEGCTFGFSLPLAEPASEARPEREFKTISYRSQDKHVLVVENNVDTANLIAHQLRSQGGYRVHIARHGQDALDYLISGERRTDLIALDLHLPDVDGLQVLKELKAHKSLSDVPIVVISTSPREQDDGGLDARAYLTKSIAEGELLAAINGILTPKAKVLIAEDDQALARAFQLALENRGFTAVIEYDGRRVISAARHELPGLILLDLRLPGMDGYQILSELKAAPATCDIPVIMLTGSDTDVENKRSQALNMGAVQFLTKPLGIQDLVVEIQRALQEDGG